MWNDDPLTFLAQINLADIAPFQLGLPTGGLLLFFFCFDQNLESVRAQTGGVGRVLHVPALSLVRGRLPKRAGEPFDSCTVRYISYPSLPSAFNSDVHSLWEMDFLDDDEHDAAYDGVIDEIDKALGIDKLPTHGGYNYHQLLGYPAPVQSESIEVDMERARNNLRVLPQLPVPQKSLWDEFKEFVFSCPGASQVEPPSPPPPPPPVSIDRCREWQLLMEFREDEHAWIQLVDSGRLYFMYPSGEFRDGKFDHPWTAMEFY
ncbi:MAG TPA: DUF1963 domain-containing protein [Pirellulaceae bacterium]|nr:DUF1963 domain-containing protein [Pirellulaceae bacterium]